MARPKKKTAAESVTAYIKKAYDRIEVKVPKPYGEQFKQRCAEHDTNPNRLRKEWSFDFLHDDPSKMELK